MFAKLLKHEWRATRSMIGLLCVIILVSGLMIGGVMHYLMRLENGGNFALIVAEEEEELSEESDDEVVVIISSLLLIAGIMAIAICGAGSVFVVIWRFYKSRFSDEGYLTFTLPVNHHQLLLSSILNSVFSVLIVVAACFTAVGIVVVLFLSAFPLKLIWADVLMSAKQILNQIWESLCENAQEVTMVAASALVGAVASLIELMLAVTIGAMIAKKHKILAAVAVYYGINLALSFVQSMFAATVIFSQNFNWLMGSTILVSLAAATGGYFLIYYLTSRRLNLT